MALSVVPDLSFVTNQMLVDYSIVVIEVALVLIVFGLVVIFVLRRRSIEQVHASKVLSSLQKLKQGSTKKTFEKKLIVEKPKTERVFDDVGVEKEFVISKTEGSLKGMLIKKFKPKIESQLNTRISVVDFNAVDKNFLALVEISGVKLLLTLDSSGKILDYKKVKQKE